MHPLVGSWELVSQRITQFGRTTQTDLSETKSLKIVTPTHWSVIASSANGKKFVRAGAGRYRVKGDNYIEAIDFASYTNWVGTEATFKWRVEGDRWHQSGTFGKWPTKVTTVEVYRRLR
jgi:hypothetical protein